MNIRLTYSDSHVPNWLLQQMICLERLDGRAFSLRKYHDHHVLRNPRARNSNVLLPNTPSLTQLAAFNIVPNIEMSRKMASNVLTVIVFLAPYLLSIFSRLSGELLCPGSSATEGEFNI